MNKILFGGSFDPIHLGHINMAESASIQLDAEVIFLPSKVAIWKEKSTSIEHKVNMINLAIKDHSHFSIDLYEATKEKNYTIDTVRYFVNEYPNDRFFYLIGADHVNAFNRWKDAKEISKLVQIVFFRRPGYEINEENVKEYKMLEIVGDHKQVSSTNIRIFNCFELPKPVIDYIVENNLYFVPTIHTYLKDKRFKHSVSVADLAYQIMYKHDPDNAEEAYTAGLLHDIGKEIDQLPIMKKHYPEYLDLPKFAYHQFAGEYIAKTIFKIDNEDILEAIRNHATGNENMGKIAKVIYASDKIEPTRGFDSSEYIKAMMNDIDEGFLMVLKANKEFLENNRKDINNRLTSKCFKYYL